MGDSESAGAIDRLLVPIITSRDPEESSRLLGNLLEEHLGPIIRGIIRRKLQLLPGAGRHVQDSEDVYGEAIAKLLERLQAIRDHRAIGGTGGDSASNEKPPVGSIANLSGYAATVAYTVCDEYLRRKYPERRRLKNRVQYLLTHRAEFSLWESENGERYGGFAAWKDRGRPAGAGDRLRELNERREEFERKELGGRQARQESPAGLASAIFRWVGGPVELDALVNLLRDLWEIREEEVRGDEKGALEHQVQGAASSADAAEGMARRAFLSQLWTEICELPPRQRTAFLLNLRDEKGCSAIELFPLLGLATIRQLASTLEIPECEFAGLWNDLPLDDARIAARLGITRQQVINLRKSARERLERRVRDP
jgi:DNA-directed RNA polymerase specialized sigma24 family protein